IGPELVRAGWLETHLANLDRLENKGKGGYSDLVESKSLYTELVDSNHDMNRKFDWDEILPPSGVENPQALPEKFRARDQLEQKWVAEGPAAPQADKAEAPLAPDSETSAVQRTATGRGEFRQRY